jgi:hypothetical protein
MTDQEVPASMAEPMRDAVKGGQVLALQKVYNWAGGWATRADRNPLDEPGLRQVMDYCLRMIEDVDPGGRVRRQMGRAGGGIATPGPDPVVLPFPDRRRAPRPPDSA